MNGLLDDPNRAGLLAMGLGLLSSRGNFANALGQAGFQGLQAMQSTQDRLAQNRRNELQDTILRRQMEEAERKRMIEEARRNAMRGAFVAEKPATMDDRDVGQPGEMPVPQSFDMRRYATNLAQAGDPMAAEVFQSLQREEPRPIVADGRVLMPDGKGGMRVVFDPGPKPADLPTSIREYEFARQQGFRGSYQDWVTAKARAGATTVTTYGSPVPVQLDGGAVGYAQPANRPGAPPQLMTDPRSGRPLVRPGDESKPLTEGQAKAVQFASRMESSDRILTDLEKRGSAFVAPGATRNDALGDIITAVSPADQQKIIQARRDFVNAILRRESGAVISPEEFANAERQYFPRIGDSPEVIRQKAQNRRIAIEGMRADVPRPRQADVDRISGGGATGSVSQAGEDPLGLRGR